MTTATPPRPRNGGLLRLHAEDNIAVATRDLTAGEVVVLEQAEIRLAETVPTGHKIAIRPIRLGEKIVKYRIPIGSATRPIRPGDYVHTHNLKSDYIPTYTLEEGRRFEEGRA